MMADESLDLQTQEKQEIEEQDAERTRDQVAFVPRVDIYETDERITLVADMPGVDEQSVDITLENDVLSINGYVEPAPPEGYSLIYSEYRVGDYHRRFNVSTNIDHEHVDATLQNGVLHLVLPKEKPTTKKISVKAS